MPRTSTFTLEKLAIKIECNFENYNMVRGTFGQENRNRIFCQFRDTKLGFENR